MTIYQVKLTANDLEFSASSSWPQAKLGKHVPKQLIVLLHGFPDNKSTWNTTLPYLEAAFPEALIIAPTMRGYEPSTVVDERYYRQQDIAGDIISFIEQLSLGAPVHLVGHDWGAIACYKTANLRPDLLTTATTLAIPYTLINKPTGTILRHPIQLWLSSYMLTMQFKFIYGPRLAQAVPHIPYIKELWEYWSPGWKFSDEELLDVCQTLQQPGVTDSTTAYYRRMIQKVPRRDEFLVDFDKVPSLILGGEKDGCMTIDLFREDSQTLSQVKLVAGVGHFMQREDPGKISKLIIEFIKAHSTSP